MIQGTCGHDCHLWNSCETKWYRGERGEEQVCCPLWDGFYRYNPDFPHSSSEEYSQKLVEVVKNSIEHRQFVTAHHFALLLPFETLIKSTVAKIYTDAFDQDGDQKIFNEGLQLFRILLNREGKKIEVLINLAYFEEYSSQDEADELIKEALKENPPLTYIIKFYRWLRDDRKKLDFLKRLLIVSQNTNNEKLQRICCDLEKISELSLSKEHSTLLAAMESLLRFASELRNDVEDDELGKLINRHLDKLSSTLKNKGDLFSNSGQHNEAQACYEEAIQGYRLFTELRPDHPVNYASVVLVFDKLKELRIGDYSNEKVEEWIMAFSINAIQFMRPQHETDFSYCRKLGTMFKIIGEIHQKHNLVSDMKECFGKSIEFLNAAIKKLKTEDPIKEKRLQQQIAINKGICLQGLGLYEEAIECYKPFLEKDPNWYPGYLHNGNALKATFNHEEALRNYNKCIEINPIGVAAYDALITFYWDNKRYKDAAFNCAKLMNLPAVRKQKENLNYNFFRIARIWEDAGNDAIAGYLFNYIITKRQPGHAEAHYRLAQIYMRHCEWEKAAKILENKVKLPLNEPFSDFCCLGNCYKNMGDRNKALEFFRKAESVAPQGLPVLTCIAKYYEEEGQFEKAIEYVTKGINVIGETSGAAENYVWRGDLYRKKGDLSLAHNDFLKSTELCDLPDRKLKPLMRRLQLFLETDDNDGFQRMTGEILQDDDLIRWLSETHYISADEFRFILKAHNIKNIDNRIARSDCQSVIEELRVAIKFYKDVLKRDDPVFLTKIAVAYLKVKEYQMALESLSIVMKTENQPEDQARTLYYIGQVYMAQGLFREAADTYGKSYKIGRNIGALTLQAGAYRRSGEFDKAIELYKEILVSGKDEKREISLFQLAKTYWVRYTVNSKHDDIQKALALIIDHIHSYNNWQSYKLMARMSLEKAAIETVVDFMKTCPFDKFDLLIDKLASWNSFDNDIVKACIDRLPEDATELSIKAEIAADYLMKATIHAYFFKSEAEYNDLVKNINNAWQKMKEPSHVILQYLCKSRGAYLEFMDKAAISVITVDEKRKHDDEYVKNDLIPPLLELLVTPLSFKPVVNYMHKDQTPVHDWRKDINRIANNIPEGKKTRLDWVNISKDDNPTILTWFFAKNYLQWLLPNKFGLTYVWEPILSHMTDYTLQMDICKSGDSIELKIAVDYDLNEFDGDFEKASSKIIKSYEECVFPKDRYGIEFKLDEPSPLYGSLRSFLKISLIQKIDLIEPLSAYYSYMDKTFNDGLNGRFDQKNFYSTVNEMFSSADVLNSITALQWNEFVNAFIDHHFACSYIAFNTDNQFAKMLHDCKRSADPLLAKQPPYQPEIVEKFLEKVTGLRYAMSLMRRRRLMRDLNGKETRKKLNLEVLLVEILDEEQTGYGDLFNLDCDDCHPVPVDESMIKIALANLIHNAVVIARDSNSGQKVEITLAEADDSAIITIDNPYSLSDQTSKISTGHGLPDARSIIEEIHQGKMTDPRKDVPKTGWCQVTVTLPMAPEVMV